MTISHIALYAENLEQEKDFFETYFGGKAGNKYHNEKTGFTSYFISFDDGASLEIMHLPELKRCENKFPAIGYAHLAFHTGSKELVHSLTETLRADGFPVLSEPRTTSDGYYESCIADHEGNRIEITV